MSLDPEQIALHRQLEFEPYDDLFNFGDFVQHVAEDYNSLEAGFAATLDEQEEHVTKTTIIANEILRTEEYIDADTYVSEGAYLQVEREGDLIPIEGSVAGKYEGIVGVFDYSVNKFDLYHSVRMNTLQTGDETYAYGHQSVLVALESPTIYVVKPPVTPLPPQYVDRNIAQMFNNPPKNGYQTMALQQHYERIKSFCPENLNWFIDQLNNYYRNKTALLNVVAREAFAGDDEQFISSQNLEHVLPFYGKLLTFFEGDDYKLSREPHSTTFQEWVPNQKILWIAVEAMTRHSAKPIVVKIPLFTCEYIE